MNVVSILSPQSGQKLTMLSCHAETSAEAKGAARASSALRQEGARAGAADLQTVPGLCLPENSISHKPSRQAKPLTRGWGRESFPLGNLPPPHFTFGTLPASTAHVPIWSQSEERTIRQRSYRFSSLNSVRYFLRNPISSSTRFYSSLVVSMRNGKSSPSSRKGKKG